MNIWIIDQPTIIATRGKVYLRVQVIATQVPYHVPGTQEVSAETSHPQWFQISQATLRRKPVLSR